MKRMNEKKFAANYLKAVKTKEYSEHNQRIDKILEMIDITNIDIEMFEFLLENKTFKKEVEKHLKKQLFMSTDFLKGFINCKDKSFVINKDGTITMTYILYEDKQKLNNIIKQAFHKAIKRNRYLIEDFELMFAY